MGGDEVEVGLVHWRRASRGYGEASGDAAKPTICMTSAQSIIPVHAVRHLATSDTAAGNKSR